MKRAVNPRLTAAGNPIPDGHERCPKCRGWGGRVLTSHHVGGGCFNDTWGDCWTCLGRGYKPVEGEEVVA